MRARTLFVHVLVLGSVLLAACGTAATPSPVVEETVEAQPTAQELVTPTEEAAPTPRRGGTLIVGWATDAQGIDPHKATNFNAFLLISLTYDSLLSSDRNGAVVPGLAESWEWSEDGLTLTMHLREGVTFHSGNPLTSEDVRFSFERILDPETAGAGTSTFATIASIDTPDQYTVVFELSEPNMPMLTAMSGGGASILDSELVAGGADPALGDVGSGPFEMVSWTPNERLVIAANEDYWMPGFPYLEGIEFRTIPSESSILAASRAGEIDFGIVADPAIAMSAEAAGSDLVVVRVPVLDFHCLQLNTETPPFDDIRVRQAISCALDRQQILDTASLGEGVVVGPITSPAYALPVSELACYTPDLDRARQLLAEAGYPEGQGLEFSILVTDQEMPTSSAEAQSIQAQLAELGIQTAIDQVDLGVFVDRWFAVDFEMVVTQNGGSIDPDVALYRWWASDGNLQSVVRYTTPELDSLLIAGRAASSFEERSAIYNRIENLLVEASPWIWTYSGYSYFVTQPSVMNFSSPSGGILFLRETWMDE